jgi:hypothetical protein
LFVGVTVLNPLGASRTEVISPGNQSVLPEEARVPTTLPLSVLAGKTESITDIITITGGADHRTSPTGEATFAQLLPQFLCQAGFHQLGHIPQFHMVSVKLSFAVGGIAVFILICLADLAEELGAVVDHIFTQAGAHSYEEGFAQFGDEQVIPALGKLGVHRLTEAVIIGQTGNANYGAIFSAIYVVRVGELTGEDDIQNLHTVNIARVDAKKYTPLAGICGFGFITLVGEMKHNLLGWMKEYLRRKGGAMVVLKKAQQIFLRGGLGKFIPGRKSIIDLSIQRQIDYSVAGQPFDKLTQSFFGQNQDPHSTCTLNCAGLNEHRIKKIKIAEVLIYNNSPHIC